MNIEKYTQNAQSVLMACQNLAIQEGHQQLDGEHLHLALLQQRDGLIPRLLKFMDKDVDAVESRIKAELAKLPKIQLAGMSPQDQAAVAALPPGTALLLVGHGPTTGARFLLDSAETTVGRHPHADIFLDDMTVSR